MSLQQAVLEPRETVRSFNFQWKSASVGEELCALAKSASGAAVLSSPCVIARLTPTGIAGTGADVFASAVLAAVRKRGAALLVIHSNLHFPDGDTNVCVARILRHDELRST